MYIISTQKGDVFYSHALLYSNVPLNDFHNENNIMYTQLLLMKILDFLNLFIN